MHIFMCVFLLLFCLLHSHKKQINLKNLKNAYFKNEIILKNK